MHPLGRVVDPEALARDAGRCGRLSIDVPAGWLADGSIVEIIVPDLVACARCEGGGCDACARSGALRLEAEGPARTFRLPLPRSAEDRFVVRLAAPLDDGAGLDQLHLEIRRADVASGCRRVEDRQGRRGFAAPPASAVALAVLAAALLAFLLSR